MAKATEKPADKAAEVPTFGYCGRQGVCAVTGELTQHAAVFAGTGKVVYLTERKCNPAGLAEAQAKSE